MTSVNVVESIPLFSGLDEDTLKQISLISLQKTYPPQSIVIHEGEENTTLYFIIRGRVKLTSTNNDGKEINLGILFRSDFFGDVISLNGLKNDSTITTLSKTDLFLIRINDFQKLLLYNPVISIRLLQELVKRIRATEFKILLFSFTTAQYKVAAVILQIAEKEGKLNGNKIRIEKFPPYSEIANMAGITRETVSRILHRLANQKLIELKKLKLTIPDFDKFWNMFDLSELKVEASGKNNFSKKSKGHLPRRGRFPIFAASELKKILLKYSYKKADLVKIVINNR